MIKIFLPIVFIWLILHNLQKLLSKWRIKLSGDLDAMLVVDDSSGWNYFVKRLFGFLKFVVLLAAALIALTVLTLNG